MLYDNIQETIQINTFQIWFSDDHSPYDIKLPHPQADGQQRRCSNSVPTADTTATKLVLRKAVV
jgi:hypothetical protein